MPNGNLWDSSMGFHLNEDLDVDSNPGSAIYELDDTAKLFNLPDSQVSHL